MTDLTTRIFEKYKSDGVRSLLKAAISITLKKFQIKITDPVLRLLWQKNILDLNQIYPNSYYKHMSRQPAQDDANQLAEILLTIYEPNSIIDLGCGVGRFLKPFEEAGCSVYGVDAVQAAIDNSVISKSNIEQFDLRDPFYPEEVADIVLCLEVLEHIPEESANTIVESISRSGSIAVITFARPGQGGKHHINEKKLEYWIDKFEQAGMKYNKKDTAHVQSELNPQDLEWLEKNIIIFEPE